MAISVFDIYMLRGEEPMKPTFDQVVKVLYLTGKDMSDKYKETSKGGLAVVWVDWTGEQGFINAAVCKRHLSPPFADHEYFICGPNVMMDAIEKTLGALDVPLWQYHAARYNFI